MIFCSIACSQVQEALEEKSSSKSSTGFAHLPAHLIQRRSGHSVGSQALENCPHFVLESPGGLNGGGNMPKKCLSAAVGVPIALSFVHRQIFRCLGFFQIKLDPEFPDFRWLFLDNTTVSLRILKALLHISNSEVACFAWESLSEQFCAWLLDQTLN